MKKLIGFIGLLALVLISVEVKAQGSEEEAREAKDTILAELDVRSVDELLEEMFPEQTMSFGEMLGALMEGDVEFSVQLLWDVVKNQVTGNWAAHKNGLIQILILVFVAAIFTNFSNVFQNKQVSEISFYVVYMLLITISIGTFRTMVEVANTNLEQLISFMKVLSPVYFLATAFATGSITSVAFYNLVLVLLLIVELVVANVLLPLIQVFLIIRLLNALATEDYLSKFAELLQTIITWTMKTVLAVIIGLNVIQGILGPAIDAVKRSVVTKGTEAIPLVGDAIGGVTEVVLGTAVVIKNGIGIAGAIVCVMISLIPMIQIGFTALIYKFLSAIVQPISDKRIVGCIGSVSDGAGMLLQVVFTTGVLFLLTIAIVATTAGG